MLYIKKAQWIYILIMVVIAGNVMAEKNYKFQGTISKEVLCNYLGRAITMNGLSYSDTPEDDYRMIENLGAKFVGRVSYIWNSQTDFPDYYGKPVDEEDLFKKAEYACKRLHAIDPEIVVQACIFEIVEKDFVNKIDIPARVFNEYGLKPVARKFNYDDMLYESGLFHNHWAKEQSVPDMSRLETKMWFFYRASRYIDIGYESIHFGQCHLMDNSDPNHKNWRDTIARIRTYAKKNARRGLVLCDSHTHGIVDDKGNLLYDFHSYPSRPIETPDKPYEAHLAFSTHSSIYRDSLGGIAPSGWACDSLPYIVEFDNCTTSQKEGQGGLGSPWVWGYEEITWFAFRGSTYKNDWLESVHTWIKKNDPVGNLEMPGKVPMALYYSDGKRLWYRLNNSGKGCPAGFGQEDTVKKLWSE